MEGPRQSQVFNRQIRRLPEVCLEGREALVQENVVHVGSRAPSYPEAGSRLSLPPSGNRRGQTPLFHAQGNATALPPAHQSMGNPL